MAKQYGFYSYIKPNTNIKVKYTIEFTRNQKIFDIMDTTKFTFDMLNKIEYDYLQDAINDYNVLYYDESVLHLMLFEQIILNDEIILEQSKDMISKCILPVSEQNKVNNIERENKELTEHIQEIELALKKHNTTIDKLIKDT